MESREAHSFTPTDRLKQDRPQQHQQCRKQIQTRRTMPYSKLNNPHSGNHINAESTDDCQPIHTKMTDDILLNNTDGKAFEKSEELKRRKFFSKAHKPDTTPTATRSE